MKNLVFGCTVAVFGLFCASVVRGATDWSAQDYDLYPGDFDGDGKTDLLYVSKDPAKASGIARSDASGAPNTQWQSWPSGFLGIPWHSNQYAVLVADFNGDGKADIFLQRNSPGDHFLLLTDANGKIVGISQTVANSAMGLTWSADQHKIIAGDFNGDAKADLFLQATNVAGTNAVVYANSNGQFIGGPQQTWTDSSWGAFKWSAKDSNIFAGDFNGDGRSDLLIQAKPTIVMVDYDIPIPVPTYKPNTFGVVLSQGGTTPFQQMGVQQWSRNTNGVDWSPNVATIIVGNFNGQGGSDVLLQAVTSGRSNYLLTGNASGAVFSSATSISANVSIAVRDTRLIVGNFDGSGGAGIYIQANNPGGSNYYANSVTSNISASSHDPGVVTGIFPATAVGRISGAAGVLPTGQATYAFPLDFPAGINGFTPALSVSYRSNASPGLFGPRWDLSGLSSISRCARTYAQDGSGGNFALQVADPYCLDGNRLRWVQGSPTYALEGSQFRTELETYSLIVSHGTAGNGPAWFEVKGKDGLTYEYGNSTDSRTTVSDGIPSVPSSTVRIWYLNKIRDRSGNYISVTYGGATTGFVRSPATIVYGGNSTIAPAYTINFEYASVNWEAYAPLMMLPGGGSIRKQSHPGDYTQVWLIASPII